MNSFLHGLNHGNHSESSNSVTQADSELLDHVIESVGFSSLFEESTTSRFAHLHLQSDKPIQSQSKPINQLEQISNKPTQTVNKTHIKSTKKPKQTTKPKHSKKHSKHIERPPIPDHLRKTTYEHSTVQIQQGSGALDLIRRRTGNI